MEFHVQCLGLHDCHILYNTFHILLTSINLQYTLYLTHTVMHLQQSVFVTLLFLSSIPFR